MTDPPPPSSPPPGWYPDPKPEGQGGLRWWDGSGWTQETSTSGPTGPVGLRSPVTNSGLQPVGEWMSEMIRLTAGRAGHFFTMIVVLLVPISLVNGVSLWYSFRDAVLDLDPESAAPPLDNPSGSAGGYLVFGLTYVAVLLAGLCLTVAAVHHAEAALNDRVELWSDSLRSALGRLGRVTAVTLAIGALLAGGLVVTLVLSVLVPLLALLLLPLWLVGALWLLVRLSLSGVAASLAPRGVQSLATTWNLTRRRFWPVLGRIAMLVLVMITLTLVMSWASSLPTLLVGGPDGTMTPGAEEVRFADILGDNPAIVAISQLFGAFANGASSVIWAVGMTLLYRDLKGPSARGDWLGDDSDEPDGSDGDAADAAGKSDVE